MLSLWRLWVEGALLKINLILLWKQAGGFKIDKFIPCYGARFLHIHQMESPLLFEFVFGGHEAAVFFAHFLFDIQIIIQFNKAVFRKMRLFCFKISPFLIIHLKKASHFFENPICQKYLLFFSFLRRLNILLDRSMSFFFLN